MKRAIIYDRASSYGQADNWSRVDAEKTGFELAAKHGFEAELRQEIKSGEDIFNRPILKAILEEVEAGRIGAIIVQNWSRLSRDEDGIDGRVIRKICRDAGCQVITSAKIYNFDNDGDNLQSELELIIGAQYKQKMVEQTIKGLKAKAGTGGFNGGVPALGYSLVYSVPDKAGGKPKSDLAINPDERPLIELIYQLYIQHGATETTRQLNEAGHRFTVRHVKKTEDANRPFYTWDVLRIIEKPIYAGFVSWGKAKQSRYLKDFERQFIFRDDLQIISIEQWEQANDVRKNRGRNLPNYGKWAIHPFAGILACPCCGGPMYGHTYTQRGKRTNEYKYVGYRCMSPGCRAPKTFVQNIVCQAVLPRMAQAIQDSIGLNDALMEAAEAFGKSGVEVTLEEQNRAELVNVSEAKRRVIGSIASGLISDSEAKATLDDLREKENRLNREIQAMAHKESIRADYLAAVESLKNCDIEGELLTMVTDDPTIFKKLLATIFKPASIKIESQGSGRRWAGRLVSYEFTPEFIEMSCTATCVHRLGDGYKLQYMIDLAEMLAS